MADGMAVAVECALETVVVIADRCIVLATIVEVGGHLEVGAAEAVAAVHLRGQGVHIIGGGDEVRGGFRSAATAEALRPRRNGRKQGEHQEQRESAFRFGFQRIACFVNN